MPRLVRVFFTLVMLGSPAMPAFAQAVPPGMQAGAQAGGRSSTGTSLPTTVDPGRVLGDVPQTLAPLPAATPGSIDHTPEGLDAPPGVEKVRFVLRKVEVDGAQALPPAALSDLWASSLGQEIPLTEVYAWSQAVTQRYRQAGYLLSRAVVPPQEIAGGEIHLRVVEGFVSHIAIEGDEGIPREQIQRYARGIEKARPVTNATIEQALLLMNDLPGITVRAVLAPDPQAEAGAALMTLRVTRRTVDANAGIDTYGTSFLGPERLSAAAQYNGLLGLGDTFRMTALYAPDHDEIGYLGGGYQQVIGTAGTTLGLDASYTATNPSLPPNLGGLLDPQGRALSTSLSLRQPLLRSRERNWSATVQFSTLRSQTLYGEGFEALETQDDQRVGSVGSEFSASDRLGGLSQLSGELRRGLVFAGSSSRGDDDLSRANGDPGFLAFGANVSRQQALWGPFSLLLAATGQIADHALLASNEFGVGGPSFGRGYDTSEITGDHGFAAKGELAWLLPERYLFTGLDNAQLFGFYDGGMVWNRDRFPGEPARESLTSAGLGTRIWMLDRVSGELFAAKPLTHPIESRALDKQNDWRLQFGLRVVY